MKPQTTSPLISPYRLSILGWLCAAGLLFGASPSQPPSQPPAELPTATATGIPLDAPWKQSLYEFARQKVRHPSWGLTHSERDYQNTVKLAALEKVAVDRDTLLAAALLHDLGGIGDNQVPGVDHAVRSAQLAEPLLREWGFPMEKWPDVQEIILGHVYYKPASAHPVARLFRDADILDFLGSMGVARLLAATGELDKNPSLASTAKVIEQFATDMPGKLASQSARDRAPALVDEMRGFVGKLKSYSYDGAAF